MRRFLSFLFSLVFVVSSLSSCDERNPIDVILSDYQYRFVLDDVHLSDGLPAVCEVMLEKGGGDSEKVSVEYKIDDDETKRLIVGGQMFSSGSSLTFDSMRKVKMTLPDLPEGAHVLHLVLSNKYGKKFEIELAFRVIRDKVYAKGLEAPALLRMEAGVPLDTAIVVTPAEADVLDVAYMCSNSDVVLVGLSGSGPRKRLHLDPQREGYASVDLFHEDLGEDPVATVRCEVFSYRLSGLPAELDMQNGGTETIQLSVRPAADLDFYISGTSVTATAAGSNQWVLQARGVGESIITVTAGNSVATCLVNVGRVPETIYISPMSATIEYGKTRTFSVSSSAGYTVEMEGEGATIVERSANSVTVRNDNDSFERARVRLHVYNELDNMKVATADILLSAKLETISLTEMNSGVGVSTWLVSGDNRGWQLLRRPSGIEAQVDGSIITLNNEQYKSVSGTILVRTNDQGVEASSSVVVPGRDVVLKEMEAIPASFSEEIGRTISIALEASYTDGTVTDVTNSATWTQSSNLSRNGNSFTALASGDAWIRASFGGHSLRIEGVVTPAPVTVLSLNVEPSTFEALVGENKIFVARAKFSDGSQIDVTRDAQWSVIGPASEVGRGYYRIDGPGEILVEARYLRNGQTVSGSSRGLATKPDAKVCGVSIDPVRDSVQVGAAVTFVGTVRYDDGSEAHNGQFSVNPSDILVGADGVYTAVKAGSAVVSYGCEGWSASGVVVVTPQAPGPDPNVPEGKTVSSFSVKPSTASVDLGGTVSLRGEAIYTDGTTETITGRATWTSSDETVAIVDGEGNVFGMSMGTAIVTGIYGNKSSMCLVTVQKPVTVTGLSVNPSTLDLTVGEGTGSVTAVVDMSDGSSRDVTGVAQWTTADGSVATVTKGVVTPRGRGNVSITASYSGFSASCQVKVTKYDQTVSRVDLSRTSMTLTEGQSVQLDGTVFCVNPSEQKSARTFCSWSSSNGSVASVSSSGMVTAVSAGTAVITARAPMDGNNTAECRVTVSAKAPERNGLVLSPNSAQVTAGGKYNLAGNVSVYYKMSDNTRGEQVSSGSVNWANKRGDNNNYATLAGGVVSVNESTPTMSLYYIASVGGFSEDFMLNVTEKKEDPYLTPQKGSLNWDRWDDESSRDLEFESNTSWTVQVSGEFSIVGSTKGSGSGKVTVKPSGKNVGSTPRTGQLTFNVTGANTVNVALKQEAQGSITDETFSVRIEPDSDFSIDCEGYKDFKAVLYKTVRTSTDGGKTYDEGTTTKDKDVTSSSDWKVVEGGDYAAFTAKGRLTGKNKTFTDQRVRITATYNLSDRDYVSEEVSGNVKASAPYVSVDPSSVSFGADAKSKSESYELTVVSNTSWSAVGDSHFAVALLDGAPANGGAGTTKVVVTAKQDNYTTGTIKGAVVFEYTDNSHNKKQVTVNVSQVNVTNTRLSVSVPVVSIAADGSVQAKAVKQVSVSETQWKDDVDVTNDAKWFITEGQQFATISSTGLVQGTNRTASEGTVQIWASYGDLGESARVDVKVQAVRPSVTVDKDKLSWSWNDGRSAIQKVKVTSSFDWTAEAVSGFVVLPQSGQAGTTEVTVSPASQSMTGATADLYFTLDGYKDVSCRVQLVQNPRPVKSITVVPDNVTLSVGETVTLSAKCIDMDGREFIPPYFTWTAENSAVAIFENERNGVVRGVSGGTTKVMASYGGKSGTAMVEVSVAVTGIDLSVSEIFLDRRIQYFSTQVNPDNATNKDVLHKGYSDGLINLSVLSSSDGITSYSVVSSTMVGTVDLLFYSKENYLINSLLHIVINSSSHSHILGNKIYRVSKGAFLNLGEINLHIEDDYSLNNVYKSVSLDFSVNSLTQNMLYSQQNYLGQIVFVSDDSSIALVQGNTIVCNKPGIASVRIYKEEYDNRQPAFISGVKGVYSGQVDFGSIFIIVE